MKRALCLGMILMFCLSSAVAQQPSTSTAVANAVVPNLINFSGTLTDTNGKPITDVTGVTFYLYKDEQSGSPLWLETQNVQPDRNGHYSVMLGATRSTGLPADIFVAGEARWLRVQPQGLKDLPRIMLLSVPYALKAGDAQTIGGLPPSAFVLAAPSAGAPTPAATESASVGTVPPPASTVTTSGGTVSAVPLWTTTTNIQSSTLTQSGTGATAKIGIGTTAPTTTLDVHGGAAIRGIFTLPATGTATATAGKASQPESFVASSFSSSTVTAVNQTFHWQAEPANNHTANPSATLNLLYGLGTAAPAETGLRIGPKGIIAFAPGQTFPGNGTINGVTAGTDLTGGGTTGTVTLNLDTTKVPRLAAANTFTANQTVNGTMTATSFSGGGAALTGVNAAKLGGLAAGAFAQLAANNTFTGFEQLFNNTVIVGPITGLTEGQLAAGSPSANTPAMGAAGFTVALGSSQNGGDGIVTFGGSGDTTTTFNGGGSGIFAEGGGGFNGGNGVFGLGGGGGPCCIGSVDGDGGYFEGGSNSLNAGDGVFGLTGSGYAGNFSGSINVTGTIFAGTKDFKIDDPLDPANKYLLHASVESSEMMNLYTGNVTTDAQGEATVHLPDWFEVLNTDFRYQLTVIGQFAQAIVGRKIANHEFAIRTNAPNVEVSWQVTGVRQDRFAKAHPLVVEQEKEANVRGFYIHPDLYGAPAEKQIEWARHPQMMKRSAELRSKQQANTRTAAQPATAQLK
jgi:trimeric autotransporter adhesin